MKDKQGSLPEEIVVRIFTDIHTSVKSLAAEYNLTVHIIRNIRQRKYYTRYTKDLPLLDRRCKNKPKLTKVYGSQYNTPIPSLSEDIPVQEKLAITIDEFFH